MIRNVSVNCFVWFFRKGRIIVLARAFPTAPWCSTGAEAGYHHEHVCRVGRVPGGSERRDCVPEPETQGLGLGPRPTLREDGGDRARSGRSSGAPGSRMGPRGGGGPRGGAVVGGQGASAAAAAGRPRADRARERRELTAGAGVNGVNVRQGRGGRQRRMAARPGTRGRRAEGRRRSAPRRRRSRRRSRRLRGRCRCRGRRRRQGRRRRRRRRPMAATPRPGERHR